MQQEAITLSTEYEAFLDGWLALVAPSAELESLHTMSTDSVPSSVSLYKTRPHTTSELSTSAQPVLHYMEQHESVINHTDLTEAPLGLSWWQHRQNINVHQASQPPVPAPETAKATWSHTFRCSAAGCACTFQRSRDYKEHLLGCHPQELQCKMTFPTRGSRRYHISKIHRNQEYKCVFPGCGKKFGSMRGHVPDPRLSKCQRLTFTRDSGTELQA
ncbi:hypothetical protein C8T65DRAFT_702005 [Cerioporus squamosus]|nr:hypothetical protein C8T65DRAFT_702005 [Cerioporus squamosus]